VAGRSTEADGGSQSQGNPREEQQDPPGASSSRKSTGLTLGWALPAATVALKEHEQPGVWRTGHGVAWQFVKARHAGRALQPACRPQPRGEL